MLSRCCLGARTFARLFLTCFITVMILPLSSRSVMADPVSDTGMGPSVRDVVEFRRIIRQDLYDLDDIKSAVSPDKSRAFIVTRKADTAHDVNVYEVLLLDVRLDRLRSGRVEAPKCLWMLEAADDGSGMDPYIRDGRWVDASTIALRARVDEGPYQVFTLDVVTGVRTQRTFETHGVESFQFAANLSRIVYTAHVPNPPMGPGERSVVVDNRSFYSVTAGQAHASAQRRRFQYAVIELGKTGKGRRLGAEVDRIGGAIMPEISVSPDGRWALIPRFEPAKHVEWASRYPLMGETASKYGTALLIDPKGYFTQPQQWLARRQVAYRLADGLEVPLADAPDDTTPYTGSREDRIWQDGGTSVIVAGTHLPVGAGPTDGSSASPYVVEFWPDTARVVPIAALDARVQSARSSEDGTGFTVLLEGGARRHFVRKPSGWIEVQTMIARGAGSAEAGHPLEGGWRLRVDQDANRPANLVALGPDGRSVRLTDLNPQYSAASWGRVRTFEWQDGQGMRHVGGLLVPANYDATRRYPVVLQTYGFNPQRFYLDGGNLVDGISSGYAGRAFLRHGILVLALPTRVRPEGSPRDFGIRHIHGARMVGAAINALVGQGIADPSRVGIMGWSVWGEFVLNMITFHDLPVRAVSLLDGDSNSLFTSTVTSGASDSIVRRFEATNEGTPFGPGLANWIARDPSLHTDCIRAAVRIENYGPAVQGNWDLYALLRRQYKPAEMVLIPGGGHSLSRPSERMISLQGNVDWYRFWLKDEVRHSPSLPMETEQGLRQRAVRWREMAEMATLNDAKPRCAASQGSTTG